MEWFENEQFWETFYEFMFSEVRFSLASQEIDQILKLTGIGGGNVLDLCCGPGRHSAILAQRNFAVTGVDRTPFLLNKARAHCPGVEFVEADMREFQRPAAFDLILNLFTSFGYFETRADDLRVLKNICLSLKPGGVFLMDVLGKEILAGRPADTAWDPQPNDDLMVHHYDVLPGWGRIKVQWLLLKNGQTQRFEFFQNLYSGQELVMMLEQAGFTSIELFGNLDGDAYDQYAARLVIKARIACAKS